MTVDPADALQPFSAGDITLAKPHASRSVTSSKPIKCPISCDIVSTIAHRSMFCVPGGMVIVYGPPGGLKVVEAHAPPGGEPLTIVMFGV